MKYVLTHRARVDLQQIWNHLAESSFDAADRVVASLRQEMRGLSEMPGKGHFRKDVKNPNLKCWSVYSYLIIYDPVSKPLVVLRVVSGHRDLRRLFRRP